MDSHDSLNLAESVAIVTGASRGVGAATAVALAGLGCAVVCAARATDESPVALPGTLDDTVGRIEAAGGTALAVPTNLADDRAVADMVETTIEHFGRVDILVNNAAITFPGDLELAMARFDLVFSVDLRAPVIAARLVVPGMIERGRGAIVNVSSAAALNYFPGQMAYGMAKAALEHFTISLAAQVEARAVAVNAFRIDVPVASAGFLAATPGLDHSDWEPPEVAAQGIAWMLRQPLRYTGRLEGMAELAAREHIMASRATRPHTQAPDLVTRATLGR